MLESEICQKLTLHAKKSLKEAEKIACHYKSDFIEPEHCLFAIFLEEGSLGSNIMKSMGIRRDIFNKILLGENHRKNRKKNNSPELSRQLKSVITKAYALASNFKYPYVGTEHLVYALIESGNEKIEKIIRKTKAADGGIDSLLQSGVNGDSLHSLSKIFDLPEIALSRKTNKKFSATPHLDQFCVNLNDYAKKREEIIIGREKEIERMTNILGRKNKNNPVLIGEPGVGKTAIVSGLAQKINTGDVAPSLSNKKILSLDIASVVAGTSFRGEFEARIKEIIKEAAENNDIILFIDEIHNIVGAGNASGGLDAANILKPALSRGNIRCIGTTTLEEYKKHIEKDPALERRFQPIIIAEPTVEETRRIIEGVKPIYEKFHNVTLSREAIEQAVSLSVRYIQGRFLPDKALDVIDETASYLRNKNKASDLTKEIKKLEREQEKISELKNNLVNAEKYEEALKLREREDEIIGKIEIFKKKQAEMENRNPVAITSFDIARTISRTANIPLEKLTARQTSKIKNLKKKLNAKIISQEEAVEKLVSAIYRSQSGVSNPERPLGSFLFLGPTGVGKTLTAKILAEEFFENPKALIRIDMSEFMERHSVSQMIGAPAGYVGYGEGGKLTEKIRRQPYSIVLFDEIEKAHPDVFNILLQILEDGILTDAEGRQVSFRNAVIILTSNLGTAEFTSAAKIGFKTKLGNQKLSVEFNSIKESVLAELKKQVKPEIINRLDNIIIFNALGEKEIKKITELELAKLQKRLRGKNIKLTYTRQAIKFIAQKSAAFDQGARLVRKNVQDFVENKIAEIIMEEKIKNGAIVLDAKNGIITANNR